MSERIYDLSKLLNMENKELMALLKTRGYDVKSPSSTVDKISAEALKQEFASRMTPAPASAAPAPAAPASAKPSAPPSGFVKTSDDLDREKRERDAAEAAAKAASAPPTAPKPAIVMGPSSISIPSSAPKPPPSVGFKPAPPSPPRQPPMAPPRLPPSTRGSASGPGVSISGKSGSLVTVSNARPLSPPARPAQPPAASRPSAPPAAPAASNAPPSPTAVKNAPTAPATPAGATANETAEVIAAPAPGSKVVQVKPPIIVRDFAVMLGVKPFKLISELMEMNIFASMNQSVDEEVAMRLARKHGFTLEFKHRGEQSPQPSKKPVKEPVDESKFLVPRAPIVVVLGHVNHGKTTLLDAIRKTNVVAGEAGGITQHTGAYQIEHNNHKITFLDTPGHAAFSKMRERGASLTDIAVLVVAADDGFMPQTEEALKFAQKANVPVLVAINKVDAKGANLDRVKQAMQQHGITPEDWGGETLCEPISALKGTNIPKLLDSLLLQAEMLELKANPQAPAEGVVVESQVEIGRGATATVIVQKGTLKPGDALVCGNEYCKIRSMMDDREEPVKAAPPGTPVRLLGWSGAPEAGAKFRVVKNERHAKAEAETAAEESKRVEMGSNATARVTDLNALLQAIHETKQKVFRCIVKADVHGTMEALVACLQDIKSEKVKLEVVTGEVGPISQNDIIMAGASESAVVGFNVRLENGVSSLAKNKSVRIIQHDIIYELINQVREAMTEMLDPELRENKIGAAEVRQVFPVAKGFVAGCMVTEGRIARDGHARLLRKGEALFTGRVGTLKRFKDDASEVRAGFECGIRLDGCDAYQVGDVIECFEILQIRPSL